MQGERAGGGAAPHFGVRTPPRGAHARPAAPAPPPRPQDVVHWNSQGNGFIVKSIREFEARVLPLYYKHS